MATKQRKPFDGYTKVIFRANDADQDRYKSCQKCMERFAKMSSADRSQVGPDGYVLAGFSSDQVAHMASSQDFLCGSRKVVDVDA